MNATTPTLPLVELRDLSFGYGDRVILKNLSFNVPRGQVTALMGVSGGGKTTVLRLIGGQIRASAGQLLFDGDDITPMHQPSCTLPAAAWACCSSLAPCSPT